MSAIAAKLFLQACVIKMLSTCGVLSSARVQDENIPARKATTLTAVPVRQTIWAWHRVRNKARKSINSDESNLHIPLMIQMRKQSVTCTVIEFVMFFCCSHFQRNITCWFSALCFCLSPSVLLNMDDRVESRESLRLFLTCSCLYCIFSFSAQVLSQELNSL